MAMAVMTAEKQKYLDLCAQHTTSELAELIGVKPHSIRRYAREFGIRPKTSKGMNHSLEWWEERFAEEFEGEIKLDGPLYRNKSGHVCGTCVCLKCGHKWKMTQIGQKIEQHTLCDKCTKGNHGNRYSKAEVEGMLNQNYPGQYEILEYGHYSQKDSVIRCRLCGTEKTVNLADMILTTTMRCTTCQTGSFGEYVIATALLYNNVPFEREKQITINGQSCRLDFLIDDKIALEYSGLQHFEKGLYYNEKINQRVEMKKAWALENGYVFIEQLATYTFQEIITDLNRLAGMSLKLPTPEFIKQSNPGIDAVLDYMRTHSSRQTSKDLHVSIAKIRNFVSLAGYRSVSDWQSEHMEK